MNNNISMSETAKTNTPTVSSKKLGKKYFLPIYLVWALIIPTVMIFLNGYTKAFPSTSLSDISAQINWHSVPAMYALYGFAYPLTIVTFPGFYLSFSNTLGFENFGDAFSNIGNPEGTYDARAKRSVIANIILTLLWVGPLGHLVLAFIYHKKFIQQSYEERISWVDYLFGFI